jgi:DNA mismatch endonuclease (patch repair protein)
VADKFSKSVRSRIMSRIKSKDTQIELAFRKELWNQGLRGYGKHKDILGKPDVVFVRYKLAIFIDGDFWHGYNWNILGKSPPKEYWRNKISKNVLRDKLVTKRLKSEGWKVMRFWEHEINKSPTMCVKKVKNMIGSHNLGKRI